MDFLPYPIKESKEDFLAKIQDMWAKEGFKPGAKKGKKGKKKK